MNQRVIVTDLFKGHFNTRPALVFFFFFFLPVSVTFHSENIFTVFGNNFLVMPRRNLNYLSIYVTLGNLYDGLGLNE